jgi:ABC-type antimicrobial peptide transport system permease subunit
VSILKGAKIKTGSAALIRKGLVIVQFAVSVVFIISTVVVYKQIQHSKNRQLGFTKGNLLEIDMQHNISDIFPVIKQDLLQTGFISNAALSDHAIIYGGNSDGRFKWQGKPDNSELDITFRNVSPEFISTSGMKIIEGRDFRQDAGFQKSDVIVTQSLAKLINKQSVVGETIQSARGNKDGNYTNLTIVGVIDDYVYGNVYGKPEPVLFFCRPPEDANLVYVRIKPGINVNDALQKIQAVMKKNNPVYPFTYQFVDDQFNKMFSDVELTSKLSGIFATLAIIISCLGLFGLATYTAERRIKEIGIRKVLGASVAGIATLLSKDFLQLVAIACVIAFPVAWWIMHSWLQNYEYRIGISWWIFFAAGISAILIAVVTISFQAIKAAVANPVKSLRTE